MISSDEESFTELLKQGLEKRQIDAPKAYSGKLL